MAWIHAVAGRGNRADKWLERAQELAATGRGIRGRRRTDLLAAALRIGDQLRPDAALELIAARPDGAADEHRLLAEAQLLKFRFSAGRASATVLLAELAHAATSDAALIAEEGENFTVVSYVEALLHFYDGRPDRSIELLGRLGSGVGASYVVGTRAVLQLAIGATAGAERDADEVVARYGQWPRQLIPALLVRAMIALERGDKALAASEFADACQVAADSKLVSALVVIPFADFQRLYELAGERIDEQEVAALLRTPLVFAPSRRPAVKLSPRELGVLKELASGGSLADVAARLHLSVNTLKVHNHAIYRKLGADGRDHAVAIARDRGII
jgi:LuxR family maltose regulon positive regulatory protein